MRSVAADDAVIEAGTTYLLWFMPALALQFVTLVMASALRGTGIVRPTTIVQTATVIINIVAGAGSHHRLGHGSGLWALPAPAWPARSRSLIGVAMMWIYFRGYEHYVSHRSRFVASADDAMETHIEHRTAGRRRVRHHVRQSWR